MVHSIDARVLAGLRLLVAYFTALLWAVSFLLLVAGVESSATVAITGAVTAHVGLLRLAEA